MQDYIYLINSCGKNNIFCLVVRINDITIYNDVTAFRPDPRDYMKPRKKYSAIITLENHKVRQIFVKDVDIKFSKIG